jgi:hypothetical protein
MEDGMEGRLERVSEALSRLRIKDRFGWFLVILGPSILFGPMLVRGRALFWGTPVLQFVPWRTYAFEILKRGHLPLWDPLLGMGAPLFANYQIALLYPPNVLLYFVGPIWGQGLLVGLHLIWAGLGMYFLAQRLGLGVLSRAIAGMGFSLSGYLVARSGFLSINAAAAWLPWIVLAADRLVHLSRSAADRSEIIKSGCLLSIVLSFQWLAGHAQTAWYTAIVLVAWVLWRLAGSRDLKQAIKVVSYVGLAGLVAFALCAVQLVPTLEYTLHSYRADTLDAEFALNYSFWPWRLLCLVLPGLFGSPALGDYWGYGNYWEDAVYFGVLPFLLSVYAVISGWRKKSDRRGTIRFLTVLGVSALVLALGRNTPIYPFLFQHVPTFNMFQAPSRWNIVFVFSFALLAAFGIDRLKKPTGRALYWIRLGTAGAGIIGVAAVASTKLLGGVEASFVRAFILAGVWFVTSGILVLLKPERTSLRWNLLAGCIVLLDLLVASRGLIPSVSPSFFEDPGVTMKSLGSDHRVYMDAEVEDELKFEWTHRFATYLNREDWHLVRKYGLPDTTLLDGIPSANNFDPLLPQRYVLWMNGLQDVSSAHQTKLLALMDVRWQAVIDPSGDMSLIYREIPAPQRVRWISRAILAPSYDYAFETVMDEEFDVQETVVLEWAFDTEEVDKVERGSASIVETDDPNVVIIRSIAPVDGWVVLSDTWFPGWEASIDDVPTENYRADFLFRAVRVPAGEHYIRFEYRPLSLRIGFYLSIMAVCLLIVQGWRCFRD